MGIVLFYWLAFCFTVAAWLKTIVHLLGGNFIRSSLWFNAGVWMLFWWFDKPRSWEEYGPGACFFLGVGVLATFLRYHLKRKSMLATPAWTTPADAVGCHLNGVFPCVKANLLKATSFIASGEYRRR
jgi:hypothetical protein